MVKPKSTRYVYPVKLGEVYLKIGALTWSMLPKNLRQKLIHGTEMVSKIRESISSSAKVRSMPPVEVVGELWATNEGMISGSCTILRIDGQPFYGVQFPASTVVTDDESLLRLVMVHEFSHCIYYQVATLKAIEEGKSVIRDFFNSKNTAEDEARTVKPEEWFSPDDAAIIRQYDSRLQEFENAFLELHGLLPITQPGRYRTNSLVIADDVRERIRQLRNL